ncbi:MAG TPA: hypothetical protein VFO77_01420 [Actinoplanes sp.]|nr:hypothetical protein [Actinoplanes sp.]
MRRVFELSVNRFVTSRWGIAVVIAALVLLVVGAGRLFGTGNDRDPVLNNPPAAPAISEDPKHNDSIIGTEASATPTATPSDQRAAAAVAAAFAKAWVDHLGVSAAEWHDRLVPHATAELSESLSGVDPQAGPADRLAGEPALLPVGDGLTEAVVEVDTGQLRLRLVAPDGRWLVDGVDWERS